MEGVLPRQPMSAYPHTPADIGWTPLLPTESAHGLDKFALFTAIRSVERAVRIDQVRLKRVVGGVAQPLAVNLDRSCVLTVTFRYLGSSKGVLTGRKRLQMRDVIKFR